MNKNNRKLKGGGGRPKNKKIGELVEQLFSSNVVQYLPLSSIFINNLSHKYVHMVSINELRNVIDSNPYLKQSKVVMNIYDNKKIIPMKDIYNKVELSLISTSLEDNVKILFQHIIDYNIGRYVRNGTDIYAVVTCNDTYDDAYETQVNMVLLDKLFDLRDLEEILKNNKRDLLSDHTFKEIVLSKLQKCSEKPASLFDLLQVRFHLKAIKNVQHLKMNY